MTFPDLPEGLTSFGAAVADDWLYVYGGHTGAAHSYSVEEQSGGLMRLNLAAPGKWEHLPQGPRLQGLALVAHAGKLYRVGGFEARNHEGEDQDLHSTPHFARYDPQEPKWQQLASLPEPRSSHDAVVLGNTLYVAGGWGLQGDRPTVWHETAWCADLSQEPITWNELPKPPFQRRALAMAAFQRKVYVIGGMQQQGGPTTRVDVFEPGSQSWHQGPPLEGEGMEGFGAAAFAAGERLYVSTYSGNLQRLADDGSRWETVASLPSARFFHRMLPIAGNRLLLVGGASMESGKFRKLEPVSVD